MPACNCEVEVVVWVLQISALRELIIVPDVCGDNNKARLILGTVIQRIHKSNVPTLSCEVVVVVWVLQISALGESCRKTVSYQRFTQEINCSQGCPWRH